MSKTYAAGAVVIDRRSGKPKLLMIHRPRYDDWSFPKGKLAKHELAPVAAVREVAEETGYEVRLGAPLGRYSYSVKGGKKVVDFWSATEVSRGGPRDDEADAVEWLTVSRARSRSSYKDLSDLIDLAQHTERTTPLIVLRHGKARERKGWKQPDVERPLNSRGHRQAEAVIPLLAAYGVRRVVSSPAARCADTVAPYTDRFGLDVSLPTILTEEHGGNHQRAVARFMRALAEDTGANRIPTAVCGHRPLLPAMLRGLGQSPTTFATADALVIHVDHHGRPRIDEFHASDL